MAYHTFTEPREAFDPWQAELDDAWATYQRDPMMSREQYMALADGINAKWRAREKAKAEAQRLLEAGKRTDLHWALREMEARHA